MDLILLFFAPLVPFKWFFINSFKHINPGYNSSEAGKMYIDFCIFTVGIFFLFYLLLGLFALGSIISGVPGFIFNGLLIIGVVIQVFLIKKQFKTDLIKALLIYLPYLITAIVIYIFVSPQS